jgi:predicted RNase H-like HicB family nuclease
MVKSQKTGYSNIRSDAKAKTILVNVCPAEDVGGYWAKSVTIPGAFTQGATVRETERNMYEAVELMLEDDYPEITDFTLEFEVRDA